MGKKLVHIIDTIVILSILLLQPGHSQAGSVTPVGEIARSQSDLVPAVVYVTEDGHIHELALKGTWQHTDLTAAAGAPLAYYYRPRVMAFQRNDGVSMVIYRGEDSHIHAIYLELVQQGNSWKEVWHWADLSAITGSPDAASDPYGYVRSDNISTVVYVGKDGHIHDLRLENNWIWADLTFISGAPPAYKFIRPTAYVRGDGINTVIYQQFGFHIYELRLDGGWKWADLTALSGGPISGSSGPSAYVRNNGISAIIFTDMDGMYINEIRLENSWIWADLTDISGAPTTSAGSTPYGFVRGDGINAIVYHTDNDRVIELRLDNG